MVKKHHKCKKDISALLKKSTLGIKLDIGAGDNPQKGFVTMDIRPRPGIDIVHDVESIPYPLPDECCSTILMSHLVEHICPKRFMGVMDELWRITKPGGQLLISVPYGRSYGFYQDPTHCNPCVEATWTYFDPKQFLYQIYKPKPWNIERNAWWETGNMEVVLSKMTEKEAEECLNKK